MANPFNSLVSLVKKIGGAIAKLFGSKENQQKLINVVNKIAIGFETIAPQALNAVALIASFTPNKLDDEVVALVRKYALPFIVPTDRLLSDDEKRSFLFSAARKALVDEIAKIKGLSMTGAEIDQAIQAAYTIWKGMQDEAAK